MRTIFLLLLAPLWAMSQEPPKGSNEIIVKGISYQDALQHLMDLGYIIDKHDAELGQITTAPKADKNGYSRIFAIRVKDSTAFITGTYNLNMTFGSSLMKQNSSYDPIQYTGWKTGANRIEFGYMDELARAMGGTVTYGKL
jgi:hypothetical protein